MQEGKVNETNLLKNIDLLRLYSTEEKNKYNKIFETFAKCLGYYKSTINTGKISTKENAIRGNLTTIQANRNEYCNILNTVIIRYRQTAESVVQSAAKTGGDISGTK